MGIKEYNNMDTREQGLTLFASGLVTYWTTKWAYLTAVNLGFVPPLGPEGVVRWMISKYTPWVLP